MVSESPAAVVEAVLRYNSHALAAYNRIAAIPIALLSSRENDITLFYC
jgi:hypothetical protein